jgi:site-specific recombinase XerD
MKAKEFIPLLSEYFTTWLPNVKGVSKNTVISYQYAFQLLFEFMSEVKGIPFEKVTFSTLTNGFFTEYLEWLELKRKCSAITRNLRRSAIVSFAQYAAKKAFKESLAFYSEVAGVPVKKTPKVKDIKYYQRGDRLFVELA